MRLAVCWRCSSKELMLRGGNPLTNPSTSFLWWRLVCKNILISNGCTGKTLARFYHLAIKLSLMATVAGLRFPGATSSWAQGIKRSFGLRSKLSVVVALMPSVWDTCIWQVLLMLLLAVLSLIDKSQSLALQINPQTYEYRCSFHLRVFQGIESSRNEKCTSSDSCLSRGYDGSEYVQIR